MKYRESYGEVITPDSYLMRDLWKTTNGEYGAKRSLATHPKPLSAEAIKRIIHKGWLDQDVREPLEKDPITKKPKGKRRHEFKNIHGFRMFFSSTVKACTKNRDVTELLLGHKNPLEESYWDAEAKEKMLLNYYLMAVPELTINDIEKETLRNKVTELTQKAQEAAESKQREIDELLKRTALLEERIIKTQSQVAQGDEKLATFLKDLERLEKRIVADLELKMIYDKKIKEAEKAHKQKIL